MERHKVDEARRLTGAASTNDIAAYVGNPPTDEEFALAAIAPPWTDLTDGTDWEALYADDQ